MPEISQTKYRVDATWDDAPHLSDAEKAELWDSIPPHQRDARARGVPQLGAGAIYPVTEDRIKCDPFEIPDYWPVAFGLDVGWRNTAALWGAWDRQGDIVYVWSEYKQGQAEPATHADAVLSRGKWIPGVVDPASRGRNQRDGLRLIDDYMSYGLNLDNADNAVEAGIHAVYRRMVSGRLKIFSTCVGFWDEYRLYRRNEDGKIVKDNDHLMDCLRYLIMSGMAIAVDRVMAEDRQDIFRQVEQGRNATTGY
jgi:hypothetical protein